MDRERYPAPAWGEAWPHKFIRQPLREFWRRYVTLQGYEDGWLGLKLAVQPAHYYGFMPHWYLLERHAA